MKKLILLALLAAGCTPPSTNTVRVKPFNKFNTSNVPKDITLHSFTEKWDAYEGQYELLFFMKNETGKTIDYPQVDGVLYVDGEKIEVLGGPGKSLVNLDSGVVSFSYILPTQKPDSVIFSITEL